MATLTDQEILAQFGSTLIADMKANAIAQGRVATHKAEQELHDTVDESELKVIDGAGYISQGWESGSPPGTKPSLSKLIEWINAKGIVPKNTSVSSLAFLIARSIEKKGTILFQEGGQSGVVSNVITPERISALRSTFATKYLNEVKSQIIEAFKS